MDIRNVAEMPRAPQRVVITGTFKSFQSVITASGRSIYTEITLVAEHVFEDPERQLSAGDNVTVIIPGGTVKTEAGTVSYLVDPEEMFLQPQKRYLVVLSHNTPGHFYAHVKNWELVDGLVQANTKVERLRAQAGKSTLAGIPEDQLSDVLQKLF